MQVQELKHLGNEANRYTEQKQGTESEKWMHVYGNVGVHKTSILDEWGGMLLSSKMYDSNSTAICKNNTTSVPLFPMPLKKSMKDSKLKSDNKENIIGLYKKLKHQSI